MDPTGRFHANDAGILLQGALAGLGISALLDFMVAPAIAEGRLVPVLEDHPLWRRPIHALYPRNRQLLPKVRAFLEFLTGLFPHEAVVGARPRAPGRPRRGGATPAP